MTQYNEAHFPNVQFNRVHDLRLVLQVMRGGLQHQEELLASGISDFMNYMCDAMCAAVDRLASDEEQQALEDAREAIAAGIDHKYGVLDWLEAYRPSIFADMIDRPDHTDEYHRYSSKPALIPYPFENLCHYEYLAYDAITTYRREWFQYMISQVEQMLTQQEQE